MLQLRAVREMMDMHQYVPSSRSAAAVPIRTDTIRIHSSRAAAHTSSTTRQASLMTGKMMKSAISCAEPKPDLLRHSQSQTTDDADPGPGCHAQGLHHAGKRWRMGTFSI